MLNIPIDISKEYAVIYELQAKNTSYAKTFTNICLHYFESIGIDYNPNTLIIKTLNQKNTPIFYKKGVYTDNNVIGFNIEDYSYWARVAYQLSHEMCHYEIYMINGENTRLVSWIEETVCEAFSMYFLKYLIKEWDNTSLGIQNEQYLTLIRNYYDEVFAEESVKVVIDSYESLTAFNAEAQVSRNKRVAYRNKLCDVINDDNLMGLLQYRQYLQNDLLLLDVEKYQEAYKDNVAVIQLCKIQKELISFDIQ